MYPESVIESGGLSIERDEFEKINVFVVGAGRTTCSFIMRVIQATIGTARVYSVGQHRMKKG